MNWLLISKLSYKYLQQNGTVHIRYRVIKKKDLRMMYYLPFK